MLGKDACSCEGECVCAEVQKVVKIESESFQYEVEEKSFLEKCQISEVEGKTEESKDEVTSEEKTQLHYEVEEKSDPEKCQLNNEVESKTEESKDEETSEEKTHF